MGECEICGSPKAFLKARVESVILTVCRDCSKHGEVLPRIEIAPKRTFVREEPEQYVVNDFFVRIREARQKLNLTQEQLAERIKEKYSVIKRVEDGWEPPLNLIKRLEKFLNINLIENAPESVSVKQVEKKKQLTFGDVAKIDV